MKTYEDKNRETKRHSVANIVSQKKGNNTPSFRFVDNRPESVQMRKWQKADDNYVEQKNSSSIRAIQRKFTFQPDDDKNLEGTALFRLIRTHDPLITEIKNKEDWECLITYNTGPYTASANKSEDTVKADVKIPGKDSDQATDIQQKNETSTYHEMVHARAIFKNEFDLGPKVYHTVYHNSVFHGREAIPLEEALTVGFQNEGQDKHSLHTIDMKNLSELTDEEWTVFAPKLKNRYKRIYANAEAAEQSGATENKYHQGGKRMYYAPERTNNDEAWIGDGSQGSTKLMKEGYKEMLEENKKRIADLKKWYDTYSSVSWNELKQKIQTELSGEMYGNLSEFASGIEEQKWTEYKQDFSAKYTEIQTLFTDLKEGGDLMKWASFKKKSNELLEAAKVLERILKGLDLADHPVEFALF